MNEILHELFAAPVVDNPRLGPDGVTLAWIGAVEGTPQIWVGGATKPLATGRPITCAEHPVRFHTWAPDGRGVIHVCDDTGAGTWQLLHTELATGRTVPLSPAGAHADLLASGWRHPDHVLVCVDDPMLGTPDVHRYDLRRRSLHLVDRNPGTVDG